MRDDLHLPHPFRKNPTLKWRAESWLGSISFLLAFWKLFGRSL